MRNKLSTSTYIFLAIGVIVLINILADSFFLRLDFTEDKRYTLSQATKDILHSLKEPITVTAYFTEDVQAELAKTRRDFKEMLTEYANISKGMINYQFINPNVDNETEQKAMQAGVQPVIANVREKDQMKQQKVYLGAVIALGDKTEVIPFMRPGAAMEYELSSKIKKLAVENKNLIGFLQGHGEPSLQEYQQVMSQLTVLYNVEPVTLNDSVDNLSKYSTVAIVAPKDSFPPSHFQQLDAFLAKGGKLFIACNRVDGNLQTASGSEIKTGLENWLQQKGLVIENSFIVDASCAQVSVQQQQGSFVYRTPVQFPYLPVINNFVDHPITKGLEQVILPFASPIIFSGNASLTFTPIAKSSKQSGTLTPPLYFDVMKRWTGADFPKSNLVVAAVLSGNIVGSTPSKIVLVSDGDFAVNGEGQNAQQQQPDNINLMVNSIDWLSDDTGLIDLRTKGVTSRPLDQITDGKKAFMKWLNFLLPIILVVVYGLFRFQNNRNTRMKRMEEGYI